MGTDFQAFVNVVWNSSFHAHDNLKPQAVEAILITVPINPNNVLLANIIEGN
jgi:hypothetical protein